MNENEVVDAITVYLKMQGYEVTQKLTTKQRGIDIKAVHPKKGEALVEAKGGTSSRKGSSRYGKPYKKSQVFDRVAKGFFTTAKLKEEKPNSLILLAVPKTDKFEEYLGQIKNSISVLGVKVLLVNEDGSVKKMK